MLPDIAPDPRKPRIPAPPSQEDIDQVSRDQALITDEWAPEPAPHPAKPEADPK